MKTIYILSLLLTLSCRLDGQKKSSGTTTVIPASMMTSASSDKEYVQIERLARPGINEALVLDNDKLLAFNSIPPTLDLATSNPTVLGVLQQALSVLNIFDTLDGNPNNFADDFTNEAVTGFLPDVMRIDVNANITVGSYAYNADAIVVTGSAPKAVMLTGGRKIEDDVIDITLSYLVKGDPGTPNPASAFAITDNVSYAGVPGNHAQGHKKLNGQQSYNGSATFPFLAAPN